MKKNQTFSEITVTRTIPPGSNAQLVDNETGDEVVASITAENIVTLDGYQVRMTEIPQADTERASVMDEESGEETIYAILEVDQDRGFEYIEQSLSDLGVPLDKELIAMVINGWYDYLDELREEQTE